jgi:hypothetical protein
MSKTHVYQQNLSAEIIDLTGLTHYTACNIWQLHTHIWSLNGSEQN